ncbi:cupin-like domain-containing protein [Bradyrhizobium sp. 144]|uniref:cupin-like domain-containing protein n=1 Tax=Bradyrhizobium sp. 144 TaxID=2782620 RepID=UPI001FFA937E|nr:cupin-like domain-containing protein [Bradyrhizobium sp. 144]MCK1694248.1 cupin-like domain-containing protein [Bradyrhizobium sp. 144]
MAKFGIQASSKAPHDQSVSTLQNSAWSSVPIVTQLSDGDFAMNYRDAMRPVLLRGACANWSACHRWSPEYFEQVAGSLTVPVKTIHKGEIRVSSWRMAEYARFIMERQEAGDHVSEELPYCHDIPLLGLVESLAGDCQPFPTNFLSRWYRRHWWRYSQFFMGPAGTVTPLHFDTLLSHNLFFQIYGAKQFILLPPSEVTHCARRGWRWFDVDPEHPDYGRFPQYKQATPTVITVNAGDVLFFPAGTLHHVRSLSASISFAIDFHTKQSVLRALAHSNKGMPGRVIYYNAITAMAVIAKMPEAMTFPLYRPYLRYVS